MKSNINRLIASIIAWLFFLSIWIVFNYEYLNTVNSDIHYLDSLTYATSNIHSGYFSIKYLFIYYVIPYLLFLIFFIHSESPEIVVRFKNRRNFYIKRGLLIFAAASIFSIIITLNNFVGVLILEPEIFRMTNYWIYCLLNMILISVIYFWIGLVHVNIMDFTSWLFSFIITFLLCGALGYVIFYINIWTPAMDINIIDQLIKTKLSVFEAVIIIVRELMITMIIFIFGYYNIAKKEFLLEKV